MTPQEKEKIARHLAAKAADADFRAVLQDAMEITRIGVFQATGRIIIAQQGIALNEEAERLALMCLAVGHSIGRDLARAESMETGVPA
jgi:hypothetical protein